MTRPVYFFTGRPKVGKTVTLDGSEGRHAVTVRRLQVGEDVDLVDGLGYRGTCSVVGVAKAAAQLKVYAVTCEDEPALKVTLVQALIKGGRGETVIETATELDVWHIIPWQSARTIVRWNGPKAEKGRQKWLGVVRSATKQSRRAFQPQVSAVHNTKELVAYVSEKTTAGATVLVLHEEAITPLTQITPQSEEIVLIVGPEGGIGEDETKALCDAGAQLVRLGKTVLRAASAGPAALAYIAGTWGTWRR
ncbi:MAG: 16S rRNA (uracil(1498)-N(3))-methyltransferase [Actinomycetaceae bacterium]|nr:16S rRNA (uracil(1498)-N(3))-methyltransferase [Actinomycetaceae bacterium]